MNKYLHNSLFGITLLILAGCGDSDNAYDIGYDAGYDGEEQSSGIFGGDPYNEGYEDGAYDADCDYWKKNDKEKYRKYCK